jgi:hypothetical protein
MRKGIICDLDGTLCDDRHRKGYLNTSPGKDKWRDYHERLVDDQPVWFILNMLMAYMRTHAIIFVTGRPDTYEEQTKAWLDKHNTPYYGLFMRAADDFRPSPDMKQAIYHKHIKWKVDVVLAIDDDQRNANMWSYFGIPTIIPLLPLTGGNEQ